MGLPQLCPLPWHPLPVLPPAQGVLGLGVWVSGDAGPPGALCATGREFQFYHPQCLAAAVKVRQGASPVPSGAASSTGPPSSAQVGRRLRSLGFDTSHLI